MVSLRTLRSSQHFYRLLKHQNPSFLARNTSPVSSSLYLSSFSNVQELGSTAKSFIPISFSQRNLSTCVELVNSENVIEDSSIEFESTDLLESNNNKKKRKKGKKHLKGKGNGVVGKCENVEEKESSIEVKSTDLLESNNNKKKREKGKKHLKKEDFVDVSQLKNIEEKILKELKSRELETEVKRLLRNIGSIPAEREKNTEKKKLGKSLKIEQPTVQPKPKSLHAIFTSKPKSLNSENVKKNKNIEQPTVQPKPTSLHAFFTSKPKSLNSVNEKNLIDDNVSTVSSKQKQVSSHVKPEPLKKDKPVKVPTGYRKEHGSSQDKPIRKELPPEMISLVDRWYQEGYFNEAKISRKELDTKNFSNQYSRTFLRHAAEKFGQDHQEIAKWLSGSDFKTVALFGCPSVEKKIVFAAKQLRSFFSIQEDIVCRSCQLKSSCNYVNEKVVVQSKDLNLVAAMRVLTSYSLDPAPQLVIAKEVKSSIDKLLKEVISLSQ